MAPPIPAASRPAVDAATIHRFDRWRELLVGDRRLAFAFICVEPTGIAGGVGMDLSGPAGCYAMGQVCSAGGRIVEQSQ